MWIGLLRVPPNFKMYKTRKNEMRGRRVEQRVNTWEHCCGGFAVRILRGVGRYVGSNDLTNSTTKPVLFFMCDVCLINCYSRGQRQSGPHAGSIRLGLMPSGHVNCPCSKCAACPSMAATPCSSPCTYVIRMCECRPLPAYCHCSHTPCLTPSTRALRHAMWPYMLYSISIVAISVQLCWPSWRICHEATKRNKLKKKLPWPVTPKVAKVVLAKMRKRAKAECASSWFGSLPGPHIYTATSPRGSRHPNAVRMRHPNDAAAERLRPKVEGAGIV